MQTKPIQSTKKKKRKTKQRKNYDIININNIAYLWIIYGDPIPNPTQTENYDNNNTDNNIPVLMQQQRSNQHTKKKKNQ